MTHTVVKLAGCSGSGKSDLMRNIIKITRLATTYDGVKVESYTGEFRGVNIAVLGSYANQCGGMDGVQGKNKRIALIRKYIAKPNSITFMEGLIVGKCYGEIGKISEEKKEFGRWLYAWLDTPLEECIRRVVERRIAKGNIRPFDPERTMEQNWKTSYSAYRRASEEHGHPQYHVDWNLSSKAAATHLLHAALEMHNAARQRA